MKERNDAHRSTKQVLQRFESNEERTGGGKDDESLMATKNMSANVNASKMAAGTSANGANRVAVPSSSIASTRPNGERSANGHGPGGLFDSSVMSQVLLPISFSSRFRSSSIWMNIWIIPSDMQPVFSG